MNLVGYVIETKNDKYLAQNMSSGGYVFESDRLSSAKFFEITQFKDPIKTFNEATAFKDEWERRTSYTTHMMPMAVHPVYVG